MKALSTVVALLVLVFDVAVGAQHSNPASPSLMKATFGKLPIYFVENRGLYPDDVAYYIQGADKTLYFTRDGITFRLRGKDQDWVVKLEFVGASPEVRPEGLDKQQATFSYFRGPKKDWKTGLKTFSKLVYRDLWPGIDLVYKGTVNKLKYEFQVAPGADPSKIRLRYHGVTSLSTTDTGALHVETPAGSFEDAPPAAWQEIDGKRVPVPMGYALGERGEFGFEVGTYDPAHPLVLDPAVLVYCGYIGGSTFDWGHGIAVDAAGNAYVTGETRSAQPTFPVAVGPDVSQNGIYDAFVAKVNARGTGLVYCGYIGGSGDDSANSIAVDAAGNAFITGSTISTQQTFPVTIGPDLTFNGGGYFDAFVAKVNSTGTGLVYCGYIGGSADDKGQGIAVDAAGNAYVVGDTYSTQQTFPVAVGPDLTHNGPVVKSLSMSDAFVAMVNPRGTGLVYCGYIGGNGADFGCGVAVDRAGNAYVTGYTTSTQQTFPVAVGPDLTHNGGPASAPYDAFVAEVNATGIGLVYCGYLGGSGDDRGRGIAVDAAGNAYVTGWTSSNEQTFPVAVGPDVTYNGGPATAPYDAFVAEVNAQGTALVYCGYLGGSGDDRGRGIAVDAAGSAYVIGSTTSTEQTFPVVVGPDVTYNGSSDAFVAKVNRQGNAIVYCGYIGGGGDDGASSIALDGASDAYVIGTTTSTEQTFPVVVGPDPTHNGLGDAYVAKVTENTLVGTGTPRPGGQVTFTLFSLADAGLPYRLGSSFGSGPIPIDTRRLDLSPDALLFASTSGTAPAIFQNYAGVLDNQGGATAKLAIPNIPGLKSMRIHTAFVTLRASAPSGISSISNTFMFSIH